MRKRNRFSQNSRFDNREFWLKLRRSSPSLGPPPNLKIFHKFWKNFQIFSRARGWAQGRSRHVLAAPRHGLFTPADGARGQAGRPKKKMTRFDNGPIFGFFFFFFIFLLFVFRRLKIFLEAKIDRFLASKNRSIFGKCPKIQWCFKSFGQGLENSVQNDQKSPIFWPFFD